MTTAAEFLGARHHDDGTVGFALDRHLHGAFGGAFGGAVAAASVLAARAGAPGRRPLSAHTTFVRGLSTPTCTSRVEVVNAGRTLTTVTADLVDEGGRLAARSIVTFAEPSALSPQDHPGRITPLDVKAYDDGSPLAFPGTNPPIVEIMEPRLVGDVVGGHAHAVRLPWDPDPATAAEAACMAADFCVGVPVSSGLSEWVPMPNPDLSVRFLGDEVSAVIVACGRLGRIDRGVAGTEVEVWNEAGAVLAIGTSSTVLLGGGS